MNAPADAPRAHHDLFAHLAIPRTFLRDPPAIMGIMASEDGWEFLRGMWGVIERELEREQRLSSEGLALNHYPLANEVFVALITMPPATRFREALFVAAVARFAETTLARCLSLELVGPPGPKAATAICEWDAEGKPTLLDENGCLPTAEAFIDAIEALVEQAS